VVLAWVGFVGLFETAGALLARRRQWPWQVLSGRPYQQHGQIPKGSGEDRNGASD